MHGSGGHHCPRGCARFCILCFCACPCGSRRLRPAHRRAARRRLAAAAHRPAGPGAAEGHRSGPLTPAQRGQALEVAANAEFWLQESGEGLKLAAQLEQLGHEQHDDVLVAKGLLERATILSKKMHDTPTARRLFQQAADIAAGTDDVLVRTQALVALGQLSAEDGEPEAGLPLAERALALARDADDRDAMLMALRARASLLATLGRFKAAFDTVDELKLLAKRRGLPIQVARAILTDSEIAVRAGRAERARAALRDAAAMLRTMKAEECLPGVMVRLAEAECAPGTSAGPRRSHGRARHGGGAQGPRHRRRKPTSRSALRRSACTSRPPDSMRSQRALAWFRDDERYVTMLLDYGHALALAGDRDGALKVYDDAGRTLLALSRRDKELARESVIAAAEIQKKASENDALNRENAGKQRELEGERKLKTLWWALSIVCTAGCRRDGPAVPPDPGLEPLAARTQHHALRTKHLRRADGPAQPELLLPARSKPVRTAHGGGCAHGRLLPDGHRPLQVDQRYLGPRGGRRSPARGGRPPGRERARRRPPDALGRRGIPGVRARHRRRRGLRLRAPAAACGPRRAGHRRRLSIATSVSVGFALWPMRCDGAPLGWERQVHLADLALYLSKAGGRNRAHGVCGPQALTAAALAAMERDLGQAAKDGLVDLPCICCDEQVARCKMGQRPLHGL
jgi:tetratricopeptide (TPR) repeat protein